MKFGLAFLKFKNELRLFWALFKNKRTPRISKILIVITAIYLISPIDIIPDYIPFAGWIDDIIIVPILLYIATLFIPKDLVREVKQKINHKYKESKKKNYDDAIEGEIIE